MVQNQKLIVCFFRKPKYGPKPKNKTRVKSILKYWFMLLFFQVSNTLRVIL